jgi:hypothetical protein
MSHKICAWTKCGKKIGDKEHSVALRTYNDGKVIECKWFHYTCYIDWYNDKILERLNILSEQAQTQILPMAKQIMANLSNYN